MEITAQKRLTELAARCEKSGIVTSTAFLSPEEQAEAEAFFSRRAQKPVFFGGSEAAERRVAFFLPDGEGEDALRDRIVCVKLTGDLSSLGHRDFLGAVLGLGLERAAVGDILTGGTAYIFCLPAAGRCIEQSLLKVGRQNVKAELVPLFEAPVPEIRNTEVRFTVRSLRLDAVTAGLFRLSRTDAAERIARGECSVDHRPVLKPDATVKEGDTIILRGYGKGEVSEIGGRTKKDRLYVTCLRRL